MTTGEGAALDQYTRLYKDHHAGLLAYAKALTGDPSQAEDLAAEARFRVWRGICAGRRAADVPAQLREAVRTLAADPVRTGAGPTRAHDVSQVGQVGQVMMALAELPQRWLRALWLTEVEGRPVDAVARDLGTGRSVAAALLHQAHEGLRQGLLRTARQQVDTVAVSGDEPRDDGMAHRREERLNALTGPALLALADTATGSGLLSLAATGSPEAVPAGATRLAHRTAVSHRGPRRRRPVGMAAVGGLVAAAAGIVTAVAVTGALPASRTAAAAPSAGSTGTPAVGSGSGPLAARTTPLRAVPTGPVSPLTSTPAPTDQAGRGPASTPAFPVTAGAPVPAAASVAHAAAAGAVLPSAATVPQQAPVTSAPRTGSPSAAGPTPTSATPTSAMPTGATPAPIRSTTPTPTPTASAPTTASPSGTTSAAPSGSPTLTPTATPGPTTTSASGPASPTPRANATPSGGTTP